ncbi:hypothetical protein KR032_009736 [Drosophila birchii]|nr:hypothetical protein KR032_009736 [Drosophila birchii]
MNWHRGSIAEAVAESKAKNAVFVVFIEGKDELSTKLERFVDDVRVRSRLETPDFISIKVQGNSSAYGQFMSLYKVVPIPSLFFIGKTGTPLEIATGITDSVEELTAKIDRVLVLAGKRTETPSVSSSVTSFSDQMNPTAVRSFAGADDSNSLSKDEAQETPMEPEEAQPIRTVSETPRPVDVVASVSGSTLQVEEPKVNQPSAAAVASISAISAESSSSSLVEPKPLTASPASSVAEKGNTEAASSSASATASKVEPATTSESAALNLAGTSILPVVPMLTGVVPVAAAQAQGSTQVQGSEQEPAPERKQVPTPDQLSTTDSETRMLEVQNLLEQKRRERLEEERRREQENELRRRREGRLAQSQQALAKEQELKNMQERIRRERQEEQAARERIRAQIAADRAEQAQRNQIASEATSTTTSLAGESSYCSVDETRLQIRLPGGINHTKSFPVGEVLGTVRIYVRNELLAASDVRDFTLAASYPRREFLTEDEEKTLRELKLVPNAVVLVLAKEHANRVVRSGSSLMTIFITAIWAMLTPAAKAFEYINKMGLRPITQRLSALVANFRGTTDQQGNVGIIQGDAAARRNMNMYTLRPPPQPGYNYEEQGNMTTGSHTPPPTPQPQPGTGSTPQPHTTSNNQAASSSSSQEFQQRPGGYQPPRYGDSNIRRLQDTKKDDDKDKATYNGNSTQQQ